MHSSGSSRRTSRLSASSTRQIAVPSTSVIWPAPVPRSSYVPFDSRSALFNALEVLWTSDRQEVLHEPFPLFIVHLLQSLHELFKRNAHFHYGPLSPRIGNLPGEVPHRTWHWRTANH